jgi:hypothetical protein
MFARSSARNEAIAMLINLIVGAITVLTAVFVVVWLLLPGLRRSIEEPKYKVAEWDIDPS